MVKRFDWLLVCLLFSIGVMAQSGGKQYNSYKGLVMAGYQGWFNTPGDGSGRACRSAADSCRSYLEAPRARHFSTQLR